MTAENRNSLTTESPEEKEAFAQIATWMQDCALCPRACHVNRLAGQTGFCGQGASLMAARAALHLWEEPCISGRRGSGAVFFSGCSLKCVYCQNYDISLGEKGRPITPDRLAEIFLALQDAGAHNINLVTPTHFLPQIRYALIQAKRQGLSIPVVYNTGSYEEASSLRLLDGLVDVYLPDLKYYSPQLSAALSHAPDYFERATAAIAEMFRQVGTPLLEREQGDASEEGLLLRRGVLVRHLVLPGQTRDSKKILRYLHDAYGNDIYVSIMNQYTPMPQVASDPELNRRVTPEEYARVLRFAEAIGIEQGFRQEGAAADESFIPPFDFEGLGNCETQS